MENEDPEISVPKDHAESPMPGRLNPVHLEPGETSDSNEPSNELNNPEGLVQTGGNTVRSPGPPSYLSPGPPW